MAALQYCGLRVNVERHMLMRHGDDDDETSDMFISSYCCSCSLLLLEATHSRQFAILH